MLFYPLLDKSWHYPKIKHQLINFAFWFLVAIPVGLLILSDAVSIKLVLLSLLFTAIPEEWFFRAYFQTQLHNYLKNNREDREGFISKGFQNHLVSISIIITSVLFACIHAIIQKNLILLPLIFLPSLLFGYLYYKTHDIVLVMFTHLFSNMFLLWLINNNALSSHFLKSLFSIVA
jgi:hypothetical protein